MAYSKLFRSRILLAAVLSVNFCVYTQGPTSAWGNDAGGAEFSQNPVDISNQLEKNSRDKDGGLLAPFGKFLQNWDSFK